MTVKVENLMTENLVTLAPHHTVAHAKKIFKKNRFNILPVVSNGDLIGVIAPSDIMDVKSDKSPVSSYMSTDLVTIPPYSKVDLAAKLMKKNRIHHLMVTLDKKIVGVLSSFDLLDLMDQNRFQSKPSNSRKSRAA